jgi:tartrate dehydrogenase/decarboxylase/D-malate dehydrogenase
MQLTMVDGLTEQMGGLVLVLGLLHQGEKMLEHLGEAPAAAQLMRAVELVTSRGDGLTPDLGGKATTDQVTDAIINAIRGVNL